jgi:hypothetical protein
MHPMNETQQTSGIEVEERVLSTWEMGYLAGVFAAWGIRRPDENEYRDAISLLMAQKQESALMKPHRPELRLVIGGQNASVPTLLPR